MTTRPIDAATARLEAALARIEAARDRLMEERGESLAKAGAPANANSGRVMALVNSHEKLREEVADTLRDLDKLIEELEG
ncbi:MAG: hypothetical protein V2I27_09235 [Erythrobacter sp.]|jgi:hypothetical protein|nr:hypothetical protein [Erythrobacter sp.]